VGAVRFAEVPAISGAAPIVGHARRFRSERLAFLARAAREQPDAGRIRMFGSDVFHTTSPAVVHELLVEKGRIFEKAAVVRLLLYPIAGEGLFTSEGELWRRQRRLMAPLFQPAAIARYVRVVTDVVDRAARRWRPGTEVDLGREMTRITMAIVGKALFDADAFDEADALGDALTVALDWTNEHLSSSWVAVQMTLRRLLERAEGSVPGALEGLRASFARELRAPVLLPGARGPRMREAIARLDETVQRMIDERRSSPSTRDDLLTRLLDARDENGAAMDDRQVRDEAVTLFVAGHETTATALTWAFYMLSRDPAARARLVSEADALGSDPAGNWECADPARLPYAIKVFKETLRLYPPVYLIARRSSEPASLGGYDLPRWALVFVSPYSIHRRPDVYPDPERFDPERFTPEAEAARPRSAYVPFGAGLRVCIGNHFALMEGPIVLAAIARRLSFDVAPGPRVEPAAFATLRPAAPLMAKVRPRALANPPAQ
jgi:cytochrome P450